MNRETDPAGNVSVSPPGPVTVPPCGPRTATVSAVIGGRDAVTVMTPFSRASPSNDCVGETI